MGQEQRRDAESVHASAEQCGTHDLVDLFDVKPNDGTAPRTSSQAAKHPRLCIIFIYL